MKDIFNFGNSNTTIKTIEQMEKNHKITKY